MRFKLVILFAFIGNSLLFSQTNIFDFRRATGFDSSLQRVYVELNCEEYKHNKYDSLDTISVPTKIIISTCSEGYPYDITDMVDSLINVALTNLNIQGIECSYAPVIEYVSTNLNKRNAVLPSFKVLHIGANEEYERYRRRKRKYHPYVYFVDLKAFPNLECLSLDFPHYDIPKNFNKLNKLKSCFLDLHNPEKRKTELSGLFDNHPQLKYLYLRLNKYSKLVIPPKAFPNLIEFNLTSYNNPHFSLSSLRSFINLSDLYVHAKDAALYNDDNERELFFDDLESLSKLQNVHFWTSRGLIDSYKYKVKLEVAGDFIFINNQNFLSTLTEVKDIYIDRWGRFSEVSLADSMSLFKYTPNASYLSISHSGLTQIPKEIKYLKKLEKLKVWSAELSDITCEFGPKVRSVDISTNADNLSCLDLSTSDTLAYLNLAALNAEVIDVKLPEFTDSIAIISVLLRDLSFSENSKVASLNILANKSSDLNLKLPEKIDRLRIIAPLITTLKTDFFKDIDSVQELVLETPSLSHIDFLDSIGIGKLKIEISAKYPYQLKDITNARNINELFIVFNANYKKLKIPEEEMVLLDSICADKPYKNWHHASNSIWFLHQIISIKGLDKLIHHTYGKHTDLSKVLFNHVWVAFGRYYPEKKIQRSKNR